MIGSHRAVLLAVVVLSAGLAGCMGDEEASDDPLAEVDEIDDEAELIELAQAGADDLETYQSEVTMVQELEGMGGEPVVQTMTFEQQVDWEKRTIAQQIALEIDAEGEEAEREQIESYIVDDTMYLREENGEWTVEEVGDQLAGETFWEQDELREQYDLLEEATLEVTGVEQRNGVEVVVVEFEYTDELIETIQEETADEPFADAGAIENGTVTQYIGVENGYIHGFEQELTMSVFGQDVETEMEMTATGHNEPVDIELPEDVPEE